MRLLRQALRQVTVKSNSEVYFPETSVMCTLTARLSATTEVGLVGYEGVAGLPVLLGVDRSPYDVVTLMAGQSFSIETRPMQIAIRRSPDLHTLISRYAHCVIVQLSQTAFANATSGIEARLSRLLLMCLDRAPDGGFSITDELLATMFDLRRASVTDTIHLLEGERLVKTQRGLITVTNAPGLQALAGDSYGPAEREYARLIGSEGPRFGGSQRATPSQ